MSKPNNLNNKVLNKPKAVIFDTDNTLYPYDPAHKKATQAVEIKVEKLLGIYIGLQGQPVLVQASIRR